MPWPRATGRPSSAGRRPSGPATSTSSSSRRTASTSSTPAAACPTPTRASRPCSAEGSGGAEVTFEALRADGVRREFHVVTFPRTADGEVVGYQGVVSDVTAVREAQRARNEFLAMVTQDLRSPITTILGLGVTLEAYADELSVERIRRTGASIRRQAERISRVADDLYEVARLETHSLRLTLRPTDVAGAVDAALTAVGDPSGV